MTYRFHRRVPHDVDDAERYYVRHGSEKLALEFYHELMAAVEKAAAHPHRHHFDLTAGCRRVNLNRFPYHFLYDAHAEYIFIFVVRHDKRHPSFGLRRKR